MENKAFHKRKEIEEFGGRIKRYVIRLVKFLSALPNDAVRREIIRQLIRSGSSIGANYFEAKSASSRKDYVNYFNHSLKSANESKFWFNVLLDGDLVPDGMISECKWLLNETTELAKIFASSILTLKGRKKV